MSLDILKIRFQVKKKSLLFSFRARQITQSGHWLHVTFFARVLRNNVVFSVIDEDCELPEATISRYRVDTHAFE